MAFPDYAIPLDNFNRADGVIRNTQSTSGAMWSAGSIGGSTNNLTIASNQLTTAGASASGFLQPTSYGPDVEAFCTVTVLPAAAGWVLFALRAREMGGASNFDCYIGKYLVGTGWNINRAVNAAQTQILAPVATPVLAAGDSMGMSCIGSTISMWHKPSAGSWTLVGSATDTTWGIPGSIAMELGDATVRVDDLNGGSAPIPGMLRRFPPGV